MANIKNILRFLILAVIFTCISHEIFAEDAPTPVTELTNQVQQQEVQAPGVISQVTAIAGLSLLPFAVMLLTSYVKVVIVLSLLRNAIGVQQSPPNQVLNGIALLVTVYVMFPTGLAMYNAASSTMDVNQPKSLLSGQSAEYIINVVDKAKEPLRDFLQRNTSGKHMTGFYQLAYKSFPDNFRAGLKPNDFIVLIPAFITSQLKAAFEVGVLIYMPFFVIDLVTSNILLAMGMMMLSPLTIALPLKLLLIVMVDGWTLIIQGLVLSFR
ncbi:MAG: EscR/YscR/HrcR family type III secretion system export apparatus protein [Chlamydiae bacterium]|nr:EscR/YscR/HrcR family type III secretion system export apparatus protein [Chlamydiota bacterium]